MVRAAGSGALAYDAPGPGGPELRVFAPFGASTAAYPLLAPAPRPYTLAAWSPDGRWLAYTDRGGLTLASGDAAAPRAAPLAADGDFPAWRQGH